MLDYKITPSAVPRIVSPAEPSVVTLMITATNKTGVAVPVQRLTFTIQAGDCPANLTDVDHLADIKPAAGSGTRGTSSAAATVTADSSPTPTRRTPAWRPVRASLSSCLR